ncbi:MULTISPECIES: NAD(P)H-dependent oxidoreductase [unclassified Actinomyces]|uniref:NAD(P)H-dependent oxidoreductase n=1 Tax=unclassified Actinomyces TaxID=2609248 RepID=UPI0020180C66|nr:MULTISPECIES: NAD(P)H-dependent oxidoreductase [unclassified Actinomyces]MCL3777641.1 NAD(P)H-dependent oxidoreductase [Actinomyces sp. AC-20-1]MCL3790024.1 NAD(P)H-dependent oxidoreductase [Actinomyces sp. 187325]MCL3792421.1 NAD(P)H-dependent oxidoreductase [Actinomyces sp. 186855]MCL3794834.1 NAD(P)H-dependent oxidoreductase [Actinomyces sp. 217892]
MTTTVLVFHPHRSTSRVNAALAASAQAAGVQVRHLYDLYPDFRIDVAAEQAVLEAADRIVLQFPMYWYSTPALLKQWQDDVLTWGWAYGSRGTALHGKELLVAVSPGAGADRYRRDGAYRYEVAELLRPLQATSNLIGTTFLRPFVTAGTMSISDDALAARAVEYAEALTAPRQVLGDLEV